jgi:hypothetical protein
MKSMFVPTSSSAITVHVTLKKFVCIVDHTTGVPDFEESLDEISGNIQDSHFGEGAMKYAYDVSVHHPWG